MSTYIITTNSGRGVVGQRVDIYGQTNTIVATLKEKFGKVPETVRKAIAAIAPETRADAVALIFDNDGVLVAVVPYEKDGSIAEVDSAQKALEAKALKENKVGPKPPYREEKVEDPNNKDHDRGEKRLENLLGEARDKGIRITDGEREGIVEMGQLTDGSGNITSGPLGGKNCKYGNCPPEKGKLQR